MKKYVGRVLMLGIAAGMLIAMAAGCSVSNQMDDVVAFAADKGATVRINPDGSASILYLPDEGYDFDDWDDMAGVAIDEYYVAGVKSDGTVLLTGQNLPNVDDWHDIKMVDFIGLGICGLTANGTIVYKIYEAVDPSSESVMEKLDALDEISDWKHIVFLDASPMIILGVRSDGMVECVAAYTPEIEAPIETWKEITSVSAAKMSAAALTKSGEVLWAGIDTTGVQPSDGWKVTDTIVLDELEGAVKICNGQWFTAGLMPDGTVRTVQTCQKQWNVDYRSLDGEEDAVDIYCTEWMLYILKGDGTVLAGGA